MIGDLESGRRPSGSHFDPRREQTAAFEAQADCRRRRRLPENCQVSDAGKMELRVEPRQHLVGETSSCERGVLHVCSVRQVG